jgi:hypothetical protein
MNPDGRHCPDEGCEDNRGGQCVNPAVMALGLVPGASFLPGTMSFMSPVGATLAVRAAADGSGEWGLWNNCPRRRERDMRE